MVDVCIDIRYPMEEVKETMDVKRCKIFVTVGSRNYPFDRLFRKLDELCEDGIIQGEMFAQTGTSTYSPQHYE